MVSCRRWGTEFLDLKSQCAAKKGVDVTYMGRLFMAGMVMVSMNAARVLVLTEKFLFAYFSSAFYYL